MTVTPSTDPTAPLVLALDGDLDTRTGLEVLDLVQLSWPEDVVLDLGEVGHVHAGGLHVVAVAVRIARSQGRSVRLRRARASISLLFEVVGLRAVPVGSVPAEAVASSQPVAA